MNKCIVLILLLIPISVFSNIDQITSFRKSGQIDSAMHYIMAVSPSSSDYHKVLKEKAICYDIIGSHEKSFETFKQCAEISNDSIFISKIYNNISINRINAGEYHTALIYGRMSLSIKESFNLDVSTIQYNLANCFIHLGYLDSADYFLKESFKGFQYYDDKKKFDLKNNAGVLNLNANRLEEAHAFFSSALEYAPTFLTKAKASRNMARVFKHQNNSDSTFYYMELANAYNDSLSVVQLASNVQRIELERDNQITHLELENLSLRNRILVIIVTIIIIITLFFIVKLFKRIKKQRAINRGILLAGHVNMRSVADRVRQFTDLLTIYSGMWEIDELYRTELKALSNESRSLLLYVDDSVLDMDIPLMKKIKARAEQLSWTLNMDIQITGDLPGRYDHKKHQQLMSLFGQHVTDHKIQSPEVRTLEFEFSGDEGRISYTMYPFKEIKPNPISAGIDATLDAIGARIEKSVDEKKLVKTTVTI